MCLITLFTNVQKNLTAPKAGPCLFITGGMYKEIHVLRITHSDATKVAENDCGGREQSLMFVDCHVIKKEVKASMRGVVTNQHFVPPTITSSEYFPSRR